MVSASIHATNVSSILPPHQLKPMPAVAVPTVPDQELRVTLTIRQPQSQPCHALQDETAAHQLCRASPTCRIDCFDKTFLIYANRSDLPVAMPLRGRFMPGQTEPRPQQQRGYPSWCWQAKDQRGSGHVQHSAAGKHCLAQPPMRAKFACVWIPRHRQVTNLRAFLRPADKQSAADPAIPEVHKKPTFGCLLPFRSKHRTSQEAAGPARASRVGTASEFATGSRPGDPAQWRLSTSIFLVSAIARAGFSPFGQVWVQFIIVWQRYSRNGSSRSSRRSPVASSRLSTSQR